MARKTRWRANTIDNRGGYMLLDLMTSFVVNGSRFDLSAEEVIEFCAERRNPVLRGPSSMTQEETAMVTFYIAPGASGVTPEEDKMLRAHEAEAANQRAEFFNYGWGIAENCIASKTTRGKLGTQIDPVTMKVSHHWWD